MDLATYQTTIYAVGALGVGYLIQLIIVDVVGILRGHVPGKPVDAGHSDMLFRVTRTVANTNESAAIFLLAILFCLLSGASPIYTAIGAWGYFGARTVYALCYYSNLKILRSICFGVSLVFLATLLAVGFVG